MISNLKIFFWERKTSQGSRLSILEALVYRIKEFIHTFNLDSTDLLRWYLVLITQSLLICGHLDVFCLNFSLVIPSFRVRMNMNRFNASCKSKVFLQKVFLIKQNDESFTLTINMNRFSNLIQVVLSDVQIQSLLKN